MQTLLTCVFHLRSLVIVTPRYLMLSTFSRSVPSKVYETWIFLIRFLVSCIILHLTGWNLIHHFLVTNGSYEPRSDLSWVPHGPCTARTTDRMSILYGIRTGRPHGTCIYTSCNSKGYTRMGFLNSFAKMRTRLEPVKRMWQQYTPLN